MLQTVDNRTVFVVDFDTMPTLPITWNTAEEEPYARALVAAIQDGVITKPGKYGIEITYVGSSTHYIIHFIKE